MKAATIAFLIPILLYVALALYVWYPWPWTSMLMPLT